jgi:hypothetical protein
MSDDDIITMTLYRADLEEELDEKLDDDVWEQLQRIMEHHGSLMDEAVAILFDEFEIGTGKLKNE